MIRKRNIRRRHQHVGSNQPGTLVRTREKKMTVAELEMPVEYRASYALGIVALLRDKYSNAASWAYEADRDLAIEDLASLGIADPMALIDPWVTDQDSPESAFARLSRAVFEAIK